MVVELYSHPAKIFQPSKFSHKRYAKLKEHIKKIYNKTIKHFYNEKPNTNYNYQNIHIKMIKAH